MTNKEAIKTLENVLSNLLHEEKPTQEMRDTISAISISIKTLKEQDNKRKPIREHDTVLCPNCHSPYILIDNELPNQDYYYLYRCPECSQVIDWNE